MTEISKVSKITVDDLIDYLRITETTEDEENYLKNCLSIAKSYIQQHTGRTAEEIDTFPEMVIVVFAIVQDMYDNRALHIDNASINSVIESILNLHAVNLL